MVCFSRTFEEEKAADKKLTGGSTISKHPLRGLQKRAT
jgi:hypothetical protein